MRVKLATQVLSHSMASTIRTSVETNQLQNKNSQDTADFVDFMNNLFDCLNSKSLISSNPYKCALSDIGKVKPFLIEFSTYFKDLQKYRKGKLTRPLCFNGFTQTINGILLLFEEEKLHRMSFLITNRLNQDVLENLFSVFRQKGGYNKNPTARTLRTSFRSNCIFSLCTSKGTNCETIIYEPQLFEENELENINIIDLPPDNLSISSSLTTSSTTSMSSPIISLKSQVLSQPEYLKQ